MTFDAPAGPFTVKAFADRIELSSDGAAASPQSAPAGCGGWRC